MEELLEQRSLEQRSLEQVSLPGCDRDGRTVPLQPPQHIQRWLLLEQLLSSPPGKPLADILGDHSFRIPVNTPGTGDRLLPPLPCPLPAALPLCPPGCHSALSPA